MKKKYEFCLSATLVLLAFLLVMAGVRKNEELLAARIAPDILRFHVLANSDSPEDQALKLEVKDFLLDEIRNGIQNGSRSGKASLDTINDSPESTSESNSFSKKYVQDYIVDNKVLLESAAETFMAQRGFDYSASVSLESCEFPQKAYGDMTFPAGTYDAVRVILGNGEGQNFWCVLYPSLCYLDSTHAVVPDESKELLQTLIADDDFQALLAARRPAAALFSHPTGENMDKAELESTLPRLSIRFKLADIFHIE